MQSEEQLTSEMSTNSELAQKSRVVVYVAFVGLILLCVVAAVVYTSSVSMVGKTDDTTQPKNTEESEVPATSMERTLSGMVLLYDSKQAFFKLAVRGEPTYSFEITDKTVITRGKDSIHFSDITLGEEISVRALELPDLESFDYRALAIEVGGQTALAEDPTDEAMPTIEERTERLLEIGTTRSFEF